MLETVTVDPLIVLAVIVDPINVEYPIAPATIVLAIRVDVVTVEPFRVE